jgi:ubiquinone biosynthesis protein Coq4
MNDIPFFIRCRTRVLVFLTHECALPLLKVIRRPVAFPFTLAALKEMPRESLGFCLYQFIQERELSLLVHYARHDLKHIVLNYDTTDRGEVCLQCFMCGNGRISFPVLATVLYGCCTMPEYWQDMGRGFRLGRTCLPIHQWDWFSLLEEPLPALRRRVHPFYTF